MTMIRLVFGGKISFISVLCSANMCRFGKGCTEFIVGKAVVKFTKCHYIIELSSSISHAS